MIRGSWLVTGTGTGAGKTTVTSALAAALRAQGLAVAAVKPIETGVDPLATDAIALARACGRPELADDPVWFRARLPASPLAATLEGEPGVQLEPIVARCRALREASDVLLVEGAGGLLVPLDATRTIADLAVSLAAPVILVAPDRLGVLSDVLAVTECAGRRGLAIAAIVLSAVTPIGDPSTRTNLRILRDRLPAPVIALPHDGPIEPLLEVLTAR